MIVGVTNKIIFSKGHIIYLADSYHDPTVTFFILKIKIIFTKISTCLLKTAMSSLKDSEEQTSPPATPGSRGVHVASSHFSNISASNGNRGCLWKYTSVNLQITN